jgi:hypothetical protein
MTLHTCEYISPRLRTRANGEYMCFAMRMTWRLYMDTGSGETSAGVRAFRSVYLIEAPAIVPGPQLIINSHHLPALKR